MKQNGSTWVLVGDSSRARIFVVGDDKELKLVQEFDHPESRAMAHDLTSDRPGRTQQSGSPGHGNGGPSNGGPTKGSRSGMAPHTDPKAVEAEHFAHSLATVLDKGLSSNTTAHLLLVAPPHFLGLLREALPDSVKKRVSASLDKDFTHLGVRDLTTRLADSLPAT